MKWRSQVTDVGAVALPAPSGVRVLMMPFWLHDIRCSLPDFLAEWRAALTDLVEVAPCREGTGYLTIDERWTPAGTTQRRPGLHVDGWSVDGVDSGSWGGGGGGGGWGKGENGMLTIASHVGCAAWNQEFDGTPLPYGDCEHLRGQCHDEAREVLRAGTVYHLTGLTVHESIPLGAPAFRQFVRVSMPSDAGWPVSCTPNPLGILPIGPLMEKRPQAFTAYAPTPPSDAREQ